MRMSGAAPATTAGAARAVGRVSAASLIGLLLPGARRVLDRHLGARADAAQDLDLVDRGEARLHLLDLELLLPRVLGVELRRGGVFLARGEHASQEAARSGRLLRLLGLPDVHQLGLVLLEQGLDG